MNNLMTFLRALLIVGTVCLIYGAGFEHGANLILVEHEKGMNQLSDYCVVSCNETVKYARDLWIDEFNNKGCVCNEIN